MKKYIILSCVALILGACSSSSSKVKNITFFTPVLTVDEKAPAVKLSQMKKSSSWEDGVNWVNGDYTHFEVSGLSSKFKSYSTSHGISIAEPIMANGTLFLLSSNGYLTAYNAKNNKKLWSLYVRNNTPKGAAYNQGAIAYDDGKIYVSDSTRELTVVDAAAGVILWKYKMPDIVKSQAVIYKNILFVTTVGNDLCAIDKATGAILWQNDGITETLSVARDVAPIVFGDKVIVGYSSGQLLCLEAVSGKILWEINISGDSNIIPGFMPISLESQPIIEGSNIYLAGGNGKVLKVNLNNGTIEWKKEISDIHSMSKSGNSIFVTTNAMQIAALNDKTGEIVWVTNLLETPEVKQKFFKRKQNKNPMILLSPVVVNDSLFVGASNGKLYKLSPYDGKIADQIDIAKDARYVMVTESLNIFTKTHRLVSIPRN